MILKQEQTYKHIIRECFAEDKALIDLYHIEAGKGLEACISRTCKDLDEALNFKFFTIWDNNKLIGYFGSEDLDNMKFLTSIFVKPQYRKREYITQFWNIIQNYFDGIFYTGFYTKNTPAINFILKNGGKILNKSQIKNNQFYFIKVDICQ